ncbi:MAG: hypothetical protein OEM84_10370 [Acidimicrobiia bacterium]|nr:hypothetical protein [Acidimicrobiia bacterium]
MSRRDVRYLVVMVVAIAAAGCTVLEADLETMVTVGSAETIATPVPPTITSILPTGDCSPIPSVAGPAPVRIEPLAPTQASLSVSQAVFPCADQVVVTAGNDLGLVAVSAQLAAALGGPLLVAGQGDQASLEAEIERLAPRNVTLVGEVPSLVVPSETGVEVLDGSPEEVADRAYAALQADIRVGLASGGVPAVARILDPISTGRSVWVPASGTVEACDRDDEQITKAIDRRAQTVEPRGDLWLVDACSPELALIAAVAARFAGGTVLLVDGRDLRTNRALVDSLPGSSAPDRIVLLGNIAPDVDWQIGALLADNELPGGGLILFPGRRIVALYGNPTTPALGVMGEQGPDEAAERAREVAAPYAEDGIEILPGFEIIATVASASATEDGDYSWEMSVDELRPWVDVAAREGLYLTLDLQPGRTDFLTQAKRYEELLLLPYVGLALDPEWRLKPNQVHLRQIGSVDAVEVNQVIDWLAGLVREHDLPQKLLILHQFRFSMITNRELIETPPELAVLVHVDGQGPIHTKYETYGALTGAADAGRWWWGWKNFYDEDSPTPTPAQVLELDPLPVYVSYQ